MADWYVKYLDPTQNREMQSRHLDTRDQTIALALDRERDHCTIRAIVGPSGEEPWAQAKPKT